MTTTARPRSPERLAANGERSLERHAAAAVQAHELARLDRLAAVGAVSSRSRRPLTAPESSSARTSRSTLPSSIAFSWSSSGARSPLAVQLVDERAEVEQHRLALAAPLAQRAPGRGGQPSSASSTTRRMPSAAALHRERGEDPLARAARGVRPELERAPHAVGHVLGVLRLDQHARVAHHLGHRGHVHHDRHAAGEHRLGHREPEALVARGLHVHGGAPVGGVQVLVGEPAGEARRCRRARRAAPRPSRRATCRRT